MAEFDALSKNRLTPEAKIAYNLIKRDIQRDEFWFKKLWNINLPDAKDGYMILTYDDGKFFFESHYIAKC